MKQYWQNLSTRERRLVVVGGALALAVGLVGLGWYPLLQARTELAERVRDNRAEVAWMRAAAEQLQALRGGEGARPAPQQRGERSLLALIDETARSEGLAESIRRGEPAGEGRVRVWLDRASFDRIVRWLTRLDAAFGVRVTELSIDRADAPGRVNARVALSES